MGKKYVSQDWKRPTLESYPNLRSCFYVQQDELLHACAAAYKKAQKDQVQPDGEKWGEFGGPWSDAEGFYSAILRNVDEYLRRRAILTGHLVERLCDEDDLDEEFTQIAGELEATAAQEQAA